VFDCSFGGSPIPVLSVWLFPVRRGRWRQPQGPANQREWYLVPAVSLGACCVPPHRHRRCRQQRCKSVLCLTAVLNSASPPCMKPPSPHIKNGRSMRCWRMPLRLQMKDRAQLNQVVGHYKTIGAGDANCRPHFQHETPDVCDQ